MPQEKGKSKVKTFACGDAFKAGQMCAVKVGQRLERAKCQLPGGLRNGADLAVLFVHVAVAA